MLENILPRGFVSGLAGGRGWKVDDSFRASEELQERPPRCVGGEVGEIVFLRQRERHDQAAAGTGEDAFGHQAVRAFGERRDDEQQAPGRGMFDPIEGLVDPCQDPLHVGDGPMPGHPDRNNGSVSRAPFAPSGGLALR